MLNSTASKREAKSYLSRFQPPTPKRHHTNDPLLVHSRSGTKDTWSGVNLGNLYLPARAVHESPVFAQTNAQKPFVDLTTEPLHIALVKIKTPKSYDDAILHGIGRTLSQLTRLGLSCVVVTDHARGQSEEGVHVINTGWRQEAVEQADRLVAAIECHEGQGARRLDSVIGVSSAKYGRSPSVRIQSAVRVTHRNLLLAPLRRGVIPVIAPIGYTSDTQLMTLVAADEVILALTREFAGISTSSNPEEDPDTVAERVNTLQKQIALDRIIVLDPFGGIPSTNRSNGSHVFINLEQEYEDIKEELLALGQAQASSQSSVRSAGPTLSEVGATKPFANFAEREFTSLFDRSQNLEQLARVNQQDDAIKAHINNLQLIRDTLALLPPSSSALLTTPEEAANSGRLSNELPRTPGVGTRSQRNPLIHNLLTDKPIFSSSLPTTRLGPVPPQLPYPAIQPSPTTFVKRGMPVTIIPDPRTHPWKPPTIESPSIQLSDPRIDLPRLIHLIEDSFGRKLDALHYLSRVSSRIAGIIIAGSYEGGAILTWETPPNAPDDPSRQVPYLDKFAVLKRSQGAGGVADIVFSAMVRDCFPGGVCWRSRRDNPVNKWYFERARGTLLVPGTGWTMFWTTEGVDGERFEDYEGVCKSVVPSWADKKGVLD